VAWLVRNHLALSITSQKQDIGDPQVINAFAHKVGDETHLDYLYVLTCADVRATNPKLWNSWKASLFSDFYQRVKRALRRGLESPIDPEHLVRETQDAARRLLLERGVAERDIAGAWARFSAGYFLQHSPEEVAWHARLLADRDAASDEPVVALDPRSVRGTSAALIFARPRRHGFARTTAALGALADRRRPPGPAVRRRQGAEGGAGRAAGRQDHDRRRARRGRLPSHGFQQLPAHAPGRRAAAGPPGAGAR